MYSSEKEGCLAMTISRDVSVVLPLDYQGKFHGTHGSPNSYTESERRRMQQVSIFLQ
jgi:hypothetical protein